MGKKMSFVKHVLAGLVLTVAVAGQASAGMITGSQGFSIFSTDPSVPASPVNLGSVTSFTLTAMTTNGSVGGDFVASPLAVGSPVLAVGFYGGFTFGSVAFGTFLASSGSEVPTAINQRSFILNGTFAPGTFYPTFTGNTASFLINFNQAGGGTNAISGSATMVTPAISTIPEPATLALFGTGLVGIVAMARRRAARK